MSLTTTLTKQVPSLIRERGQQYCHSGAVRIQHGDAWCVEARVRGSQTYQVSLFRTGNTIESRCSCPYFDDNFETCKHIWATILMAQASGYLHGDGGSAKLRLTEMTDEDEETADDYEEEDHQDRQVPLPPGFGKQSWKQAVAYLKGPTVSRDQQSWPPEAEPVYIVDVAATLQGQGLTVELAARTRKKNGAWSIPKPRRIAKSRLHELADPADRQVLGLMIGADQEHYGYSYNYYGGDGAGPRFRLSAVLQGVVMPLICATGRCFLRLDAELYPLTWDDGPPWTIQLRVVSEAKGYEVVGKLVRNEEALDLREPRLMVAGGLVFTGERVARLEDGGAFPWLSYLRQQRLIFPEKDKDRWLQEILALDRVPPLELPDDLKYEELTLSPQFRLKIAKCDYAANRLAARLFFRYGAVEIPSDENRATHYRPEDRQLIRRDAAAERQALAQLHQLGLREQRYYGRPETHVLAARNLPQVVQTLTAAGWLVEADGKLYRHGGQFNIEVRSGIDWFELHGGMTFDDQAVSLPELLAAVRKGDTSVRLGDGSFGMLPDDWLKKHGLLTSTGKAEGDHLRFSRAQVGLLDALLSAQPEARFDATFARARHELRRFEGIEPAEPPAEFTGALRGYQKEGLGWLHFLERFGMGGCLADDMGLGKTVMVLALLEARRQLRASQKNGQRPPPSLVVVPRSLIFNWREEAKRFTPQVRLLEHSGIGREPPGSHFHDHDLILTTYGTLRRDVPKLADFTFDYCILDEGQAIKNSSSDSAKAVRLIQARQRLVLSGTPVENHLGELWSLLDFLNPGMLGSGSALKLEGGWRNPSEETRQLLAKALRPVILRRTKEQVAKDLPAKTEQTIWCELDGEQRRQYNELRDHYRQSLLARVQRDGIHKSKMHILEALLRLRQAACHPGLVDKKRTKQSSGKLEALLPQLAEVTEEGHKVLVFSQFTSLLAIVRARLEGDKIPYQYLDGKTRDRQAKVDAFQNDPDCKLFLISLKAGGLGLNLTAAEYVFLLDPWWNPAVEAQAIDRAHRIGQTKPVFAYRLIAKDTVEEKVLELQKHKRELADAIINADNSLIRSLGREDLELLLS